MIVRIGVDHRYRPDLEALLESAIGRAATDATGGRFMVELDARQLDRLLAALPTDSGVEVEYLPRDSGTPGSGDEWLPYTTGG